MPTDKDWALELELVEHAYLLTRGWRYGTYEDEFYWEAPVGHTGSHRFYETRGHAINSTKKAALGRPTKGPGELTKMRGRE